MASDLTVKSEALSSLDANPWEQREDLGWLRAFVRTVLAVARRPRRLFAVTRADHGLLGPLLFGVIVGMLGTLLEAAMLSLLGPLFSGWVETELGVSDPITISGLDTTTLPDWMLSFLGCQVAILALPVGLAFYVLLFLFWCAFVHLGLWVSGGLRQSRSGFAGTVAVTGYASTASLAQVVPVVGDLLFAGLLLVLTVIGLEALHSASRGRAVTAVVLPPAVLILVGLTLLAVQTALSCG